MNAATPAQQASKIRKQSRIAAKSFGCTLKRFSYPEGRVTADLCTNGHEVGYVACHDNRTIARDWTGRILWTAVH